MARRLSSLNMAVPSCTSQLRSPCRRLCLLIALRLANSISALNHLPKYYKYEARNVFVLNYAISSTPFAFPCLDGVPSETARRLDDVNDIHPSRKVAV
jgi:hypothetical protein